MSLVGERVLLKIYLQSADRAPHAPTYQRIIKAAQQAKLAGITVLRGILGAGHHGVHKSLPWSMVEHLPMVIEIVETAERIAEFVQGPLDRLMIGGMATLERAAVVMYRDKDQPRPTLNLISELPPLSTVPHIQPGSHMTVNTNGVLLRVFIGESDKFENKPLFEAIVQKARDLGLAGATVLRGSEGFGANSVVHKASLLEMSSDLPVLIEIVDTEEKIALLHPHLEQMVKEGMITMEYVVILMYRDNAKATV